MKENTTCSACLAIGHDCGGHWGVWVRSASHNKDQRRGRVDLDILDGYSHFRADNDDHDYDDQ